MNRAFQATTITLLLAVALATAQLAPAQTVTITPFTDGQTASAGAVNGNFNSLKSAVDTHTTNIAGKMPKSVGSCAPGYAIRALSTTGVATCQKVDGGVISVSLLGSAMPFYIGTNYEIRAAYSGGAWGIGGNCSSTLTSAWAVAPVALPHGATITKVTYFIANKSGSSGYAALHYSGLTTFGTMASFSVPSNTTTPNQKIVDTTINFAVVDSVNYSYWLEFNYGAGAQCNNWVPLMLSIEYTY